MAVAAETFGNATPAGTFLASLIFGAADAISDRVHTAALPPQFVLMIPYLAALAALAVTMQRARRRRTRLTHTEG